MVPLRPSRIDAENDLDQRDRALPTKFVADANQGKYRIAHYNLRIRQNQSFCCKRFKDFFKIKPDTNKTGIKSTRVTCNPSNLYHNSIKDVTRLALFFQYGDHKPSQ
jgi:hypothetical protein